MIIRDANENEKNRWNEFVIAHFPIVGAFFQSWEWGEFQRSLGYAIRRLIVENERGEWQGLTLAVTHRLPLNFSYCYLPRGPVLTTATWNSPGSAHRALTAIRATLQTACHQCIFIRMEPAIEHPPVFLMEKPFRIPPYYIQPRFNTVVDLAPSEEKILQRLSAPMRNNVRKAVRKGVRVELKNVLTENEWRAFAAMRRDTASRARNRIFPDERYFRNLTTILPSIASRKPGDIRAHSGIFVATHNGELAAINIVIFFADTATFLFGAAFTRKLPFKVSPAIHWASLIEAKNRGFRWYDLGGVDATRWKTLTYFKEQFGGSRVEYMGNVDAVAKPILYVAYQMLRGLRH